MILYTDNDPKVCAWLWELQRDVVPRGLVSEQDIFEFKTSPYALRHYEQVHFFAGIGGWPYALKLAGWPLGRQVWTASCPCQPFSCAGKAEGLLDSRHVWPAFRRLVAECRPATIFGEQVASKDGRAWLAGIRFDLERMGYAFGAADLCAAGVGAPHIRQRLYWVADAGRLGTRRTPTHRQEESRRTHRQFSGCGDDGRMADGSGRGRGIVRSASGETGHAHERSETSRMGDACCERGQQERRGAPGNEGSDGRKQDRNHESASHGANVWSNSISIPCRDGKARRAQPGIFPLAARLPSGLVPSGDPSIEEANTSQEARVMRLRGYGNSIVPQLAAEFVRAFMETLQ